MYESTKVLSKVLSYFSPEVQYYVVLPEVRTEVLSYESTFESTKVLSSYEINKQLLHTYSIMKVHNCILQYVYSMYFIIEDR